jgi:hypothetical protein
MKANDSTDKQGPSNAEAVNDTNNGTIYVQYGGDEFRRTHATMAQVVEAYRLLIIEILPKDNYAVQNARRLASLLGHTLPAE